MKTVELGWFSDCEINTSTQNCGP